MDLVTLRSATMTITGLDRAGASREIRAGRILRNGKPARQPGKRNVAPLDTLQWRQADDNDDRRHAVDHRASPGGLAREEIGMPTACAGGASGSTGMQPVAMPPPLVVAFHKPVGCVTTMVEECGAPTVLDVMGHPDRNLRPIGRLDKVRGA